jgi:hypothetical protein
MGACFTLEWLKMLLIWLVVIVVIVAIFKVIVPWVMSQFASPPGGGNIMTILGYILWGIVAIFAIIFVFELIACLGGGSLGRIR